jgi:hemoglobin-like flavoprotein
VDDAAVAAVSGERVTPEHYEWVESRLVEALKGLRSVEIPRRDDDPDAWMGPILDVIMPAVEQIIEELY